MRANIAYVHRVQISHLQRFLDTHLHRLTLRLGNVCRIAVSGKTDDFAVDFCPARLGVFQLLQNQRPRTFTDD